MKVIIVGGVAGGASCAPRLRRLDEKTEILLVECGPYVSYANWVLPNNADGTVTTEAYDKRSGMAAYTGCQRSDSWRAQHPAAGTPRAPGRTPSRPRDSRHLPCRQRANYATRILLQKGRKARTISGGRMSRAMHITMRSRTRSASAMVRG